MSEVDHPLIKKSADSFGANQADDLHSGPIQSSQKIPLLEIRQSQWRGGVWIDRETGQPWLIVAGLAKGGHQDRDDFYERVKRAEQADKTKTWLPDTDDRRQLSREVAAALLIDWELQLQEQMLEALESVVDGGETTLPISHPKESGRPFGSARVTVEPVREPDYEQDELLLELDFANDYKGTNLAWVATLRLLATINPAETAWDLGGDMYSPTPDAGELPERIVEMRALAQARDLAVLQPNSLAHYAHRRSIAEASVEGKGIRSLCGIYFVPTQDHDKLSPCATCEERYRALP